jgi:putative FmdB family regulatory protein
MPIYEYVCTTCGKEVEVMQKFSDKPLKKCTCSSKGRLERKLSVPSFHLQGGGWYNEGYSGKKDGNGKAAEKSDAKPEAKTDAKSETKSGGTEASGAPKAEPSGSKSESSGSKKEASGTKKETKKPSAPTAAV